jgi:signal transduction histidine kinase
MPILGGSGHGVGVWTTKMFPGLPGSNRFRAYVMVACLGAGALLCVILTLLVVRNLQAGVQKLERGLQELEADLTSQIQTQGEPDEIKRIALAVNRLGAALKGKIESEKMTEDRLRHSERLAALGRLVAGVAHEVRNPLATIRLRVQMCQEATDEPLIQQSCAVALEEIERLNGMVNRLLSFSRPVRLHPEPTNLPHLVEQRLAYFRESALNHRVKVISNSGENSRLVSVDQSRMTQVFDNVIQNAIEAMSERGGNLCVNINTDVDNGPGSSVCVEFNDTGNGIAEADLDRVFDPFFTTKPTGTGLGLSICHELVRAQGGEIQIVSARGHGTSVRVVLPTNHELATSASG